MAIDIGRPVFFYAQIEIEGVMVLTVEATIVFGLITCFIGIAGFIGGKQAAARKDGSEWGELISDIRHIKDDIADIKQASVASTAELKQSISRVYGRIDERFADHLKHYHNQ